MTELITKKELAGELGVSPSRVSQLVKQGLPVRIDGRLDAQAARTWVKENVVSHRGGWGAGLRKRERVQTPEASDIVTYVEQLRKNAAVLLPRVARRQGWPEEVVATISDVFDNLLLIFGNYDEFQPDHEYSLLDNPAFDALPKKLRDRSYQWLDSFVDVIVEEFKKAEAQGEISRLAS